MPDTPSGDPVAHYYDTNTRRFLIVGRGGAAYSIHRQLWGPGVRTTAEAADYINRLIADRIDEVGVGPDVTILDMGCGVGGTLFHLAARFPVGQLHGITISPKQRDIATRLVARKGLEHRCRVHLGDFQHERLEVHADVIVAVESFVHAESPERFFTWAAQRLRAGGHLLLVDDFLESDTDALDDRQRRHVADLRVGWRAPGLCTVAECVRAATQSGLELSSDEDLTDLIRLGRPRDLAVAFVAPAVRRLGLGRSPFFGNILGGGALRVGLREGFFSYRFLAFRSRSRVGETRDGTRGIE